jgi:HJR/Mrr/RecB family endonuclease
VVTSSVFTEGAREIARSGKVTLWDRSELIRLLARHRVLLG